MTGQDYAFLVGLIAVVLLVATVAASLLEAIGADRIARWLHLTGDFTE